MLSHVWYFFKIVVCVLISEKNWFWSLNEYDVVMEKVLDEKESVECMRDDPVISKLLARKKMQGKKKP